MMSIYLEGLEDRLVPLVQALRLRSWKKKNLSKDLPKQKDLSDGVYWSDGLLEMRWWEK